MAIDFLRWGYRSKMQTWQGGYDPVDIVWFRVPDSYGLYESPTPFRSSVWLEDPVNDGLGEQREELPDGRPAPLLHSDGAWPAVYLGGHVEGGDAWDEGGVEGETVEIITGPHGVPPGCPTLSFDGGGEEEGGDATFPVEPPEIVGATSHFSFFSPAGANVPAGTANGQLVFGWCYAGNCSAIAPVQAGWTVMYDGTFAAGWRLWMGWRRKAAGEVTYTWNVTWTGIPNARTRALSLADAADPTLWTFAVGSTAAETADGIEAAPPGLLLGFYIDDGNPIHNGLPYGMSSVIGVGDATFVCGQVGWEGGDTGDDSWPYFGGASAWWICPLWIAERAV